MMRLNNCKILLNIVCTLPSTFRSSASYYSDRHRSRIGNRSLLSKAHIFRLSWFYSHCRLGNDLFHSFRFPSSSRDPISGVPVRRSSRLRRLWRRHASTRDCFSSRRRWRQRRRCRKFRRLDSNECHSLDQQSAAPKYSHQQ